MIFHHCVISSHVRHPCLVLWITLSLYICPPMLLADQFPPTGTMPAYFYSNGGNAGSFIKKLDVAIPENLKQIFSPTSILVEIDRMGGRSILLPIAVMLTSSAAMSVIAIAWSLYRNRARRGFGPEMEALKMTSERIDNFLATNSYARDSHRQILVDMAGKALSATRTARWRFLSSLAEKQLTSKVERFFVDSKSLVANANKLFVESELLTFSEFFDTVESKPLTPAQRRSCVVSEDNNLVLAGAGTGKTSTMIGRAGYLLASKRARPDQLLMLAYAKKAAEEMQERQNSRLQPWLSSGVPTIKTFHALGLEIIGAVEGRRPDLTPMAEDKKRFGKFIDSEITKHCDEPEYRAMLVRYYGSERFPYRNPFDFDSMQDYYNYVRANELRTLKGEVVKSFEECVIANFLSANSINYEYEHPYEIDTSGPDFRQYKPDFFLPDNGVYIEHFALDREGQPPFHFDQRKYLEGIKWKRALHLKHGTKLVETYSYLKREGLLESVLAESLLTAGIELHPKSDEELLLELRQSSEITDFAELMSGFVDIFKQSGHDLDSVRKAALKHIDATRLLLLLDLFSPILKAYEDELAKCRQIDFADMIRRAIAHVESNSFESPYSHILVDEFQDISSSRARLISSLVKQQSESVLFVVGDDWQSIYRFTGSDISYTRDFQKKFGATAITPLDTTFRFNDQIGDVASKFVLKNPAQIVKSIQSIAKTPHPAISLIRSVSTEVGLNMALDAIDKRMSHGLEHNPTVLVLGRYNFVVDEWSTPAEKRRIRTLYPSLDIKFMTVHAAKGKEADFVVVLGLGRGKHGFPSEKPTDSVLDFLLPEQESFSLAEERRLFYVALTRARHRVYLAYNPMETSTFVLELLNEENGYPICTDEFDSELTCEGIANVPCPNCGTGSLIPKEGAYGAFVACNNFPYCKYKEHPCPQCGGLMRRRGGSRVCTKRACSTEIPICPKCGGEMVERSGPSGRFFGCINYRRDADFFCTHTINISSHAGRRRLTS